MHVDDLVMASSVQHGDRVTFFGADQAVLVDVGDPVVPRVVAAVFVPELVGAASPPPAATSTPGCSPSPT